MYTPVNHGSENISVTNRVVRSGLGLAAIVAAMLIPALPASVIAAIVIVAVYTVFTGIIGIDPFLDAKQPSTTEAVRQEARVVAHPAKARPVAGSDDSTPKKAA